MNDYDDDIAALFIVGFSKTESKKCREICKRGERESILLFSPKIINISFSFYNNKRKEKNRVLKIREV
jgi:hypothetical protein